MNIAVNKKETNERFDYKTNVSNSHETLRHSWLCLPWEFEIEVFYKFNECFIMFCVCVGRMNSFLLHFFLFLCGRRRNGQQCAYLCNVYVKDYWSDADRSGRWRHPGKEDETLWSILFKWINSTKCKIWAHARDISRFLICICFSVHSTTQHFVHYLGRWPEKFLTRK